MKVSTALVNRTWSAVLFSFENAGSATSSLVFQAVMKSRVVGWAERCQGVDGGGCKLYSV